MLPVLGHRWPTLLVIGVTLQGGWSPCLAELRASFELTSDHPCYFAASILERTVDADDGVELQCDKAGVQHCETNTEKSTRFTFVTGRDGAPLVEPRISFVIINSCRGGGETTVQRFGIFLELYGHDQPFAIGRRFCPGKDSLHSDDSCCVLNLCNGRFGETGSCKTECDGTTLSLQWNITWPRYTVPSLDPSRGDRNG
jgi:hypothetical protein